MLTVDASVASRRSHGGTAPDQVRARIAQSFESILSMSQRLQYELQRWHAQWVHAGESLKQESSLRHSLQLRTGQLQAKVKQLEDDERIAAVSLTHPPSPNTSPSPCLLSVRYGAGRECASPTLAARWCSTFAGGTAVLDHHWRHR